MSEEILKVDSVRMLIIVLSAIAVFSPVSVYGVACQKPEPLFIVERSKNKNTVHYDVCIGNDDDMSGIAPVTAYWIMESGKKEELNKLEREYAYGIAKQEMLGQNRVRINIVSMKERAITVEKVGDRYKAVALIDGKESILEKVYIKSHELIIGLPRVEFIDLSGRTRAEDLPVNERIVKH